MELFKDPENLNKDFLVLILSTIYNIDHKKFTYDICKLMKSIKEQHHVIRFKTISLDKLRRRLSSSSPNYYDISSCISKQRLDYMLGDKIYKSKTGYVHVLSFDVRIDEKSDGWIIDLNRKFYWNIDIYLDILPMDVIQHIIIKLLCHGNTLSIKFIDSFYKHKLNYTYIFSQVYPHFFNYIKKNDKVIRKGAWWYDLLQFTILRGTDDENNEIKMRLLVNIDEKNNGLVTYLSSIGIKINYFAFCSEDDSY